MEGGTTSSSLGSRKRANLSSTRMASACTVARATTRARSFPVAVRSCWVRSRTLWVVDSTETRLSSARCPTLACGIAHCRAKTSVASATVGRSGRGRVFLLPSTSTKVPATSPGAAVTTCEPSVVRVTGVMATAARGGVCGVRSVVASVVVVSAARRRASVVVVAAPVVSAPSASGVAPPSTSTPNARPTSWPTPTRHSLPRLCPSRSGCALAVASPPAPPCRTPPRARATTPSFSTTSAVSASTLPVAASAPVSTSQTASGTTSSSRGARAPVA